MNNTEVPALALTGNHASHLVTLGPSTASAAANDKTSEKNWIVGNKNFILRHQDRYLQRLAALRETLLKENKDFVHVHLPKPSEKQTGFWEAVMADFADATLSKNGRRLIPGNALIGSNMLEEQNRRGHLERLRRIRIMQKRRRLPPQLEPLHGIGLGKKPEVKAKPKQSPRVPPTAYHVDWMRGNQMITPVGDHEKAINSWTLKHLRTVDAVPLQEPISDLQFPSDIRELLRRTRRSVDSTAETKADPKNPETVPSIKTLCTPPVSAREKQSPLRATPRTFTPPYPPPPPASSPTPNSEASADDVTHPLASVTIQSTSSASHRDAGSEAERDTPASRESTAISDDRVSSPVVYRLPPLQQGTRSTASSSATSRKQIVIKIPHGIK